LTEEDIDAMFPSKITYAFLVDAKWRVLKIAFGVTVQDISLPMRYATAHVGIVTVGLATKWAKTLLIRHLPI
jgi:hypothetical protein